MKTDKALKIIAEFKGDLLYNKMTDLKSDILNNGYPSFENGNEIFEAALEVKKISAQINEIVHAVGIVNTLPKILEPNEKVENVSLASGASTGGFDLETDKRIAEFKFATWQKKGNGWRKRQIVNDLVKLTIANNGKIKELYTFDAETIIKFLNGKSSWRNKLSKAGAVKENFEDYLKSIKRTDITSIKEVYEISNVKIIGLEQHCEKPDGNNV